MEAKIITWNFWNIQLTKHKSFEYQLDLGSKFSSSEFFELSFKWTTKQDHAGPSFTFSIYRVLFLTTLVYDNRHWNIDNDAWEVYPDKSTGEQ